MMTPKECAEGWKTVVEIYKEDKLFRNNPVTCMQKIIEKLGKEKTMEVFATVAAIKKNDGRISKRNRTVMDSVPINPDAVLWERGNPMIYAGLDDIHTAHIDNLITQLVKL